MRRAVEEKLRYQKMGLGEGVAWLSLIQPLWNLLSKVLGLAPAAALPFQGFLLPHWLSAPSPHLHPLRLELPPQAALLTRSFCPSLEH